MNKAILSIFVAALIVLTWSCSQQENNSFTLNIEVEGSDNGKLTFQQRKNGEWVKADSVVLVGGKGTITGELAMPEFYYVILEGSREYMPLFLEKGEVNALVNILELGKPVVTGSESHKVYESFIGYMDEFDELSKPLGEQYRQARAANDEELMEQIVDEFEELDEKKGEYILNFAVKTNKSVVAPFSVMNYSYMFELEELERVSNALDPSISASTYTKSLNDRVSTLQRVAVGQKFVDFTLNDPDGNPISVSSAVKGKYVLVDFWASWCGPCRAENPNVVAAYNTYHDKGFDVFGVSFDKSHDKWVQAIQADNLTWTHVSDLKYWASEAGKLYGVNSIPHSILLDPEGTIIAKNLRGKELQDKLAELMN